MPGRHRQRAEQDRPAPSEQAISEKPAKDRREINARGVGTEDRRSEGLSAQPAVKFPEGIERRDVFDVSREEEILHHVKHEQRLHPVEGEALPRLGEGEIPKPARMPEEIRRAFFAGEWRGILGLGGSGHAREVNEKGWRL